MHISKMIMTVAGLLYFSATIWDVFTSYIYLFSPNKDICFKKHYNVDKLQPIDEIIFSAYFAFTTLSSVGFGDAVPKTDIERLICAFMMLFGVAMFSYVQTISMQTINKLIKFN
jgi:hypothetical protein